VKKPVIVVAILLLMLVAAPWGIGRIAEHRVDRGIDQLVEVAPYLGVAERRYTPGWFRSEQEVTFEVLGPGAREAGSSDGKPPRFTIRNEILHGPVLWTSGFGIARVNTRIAVPETVRRSILETFGTDEPLRISTRIGFFGGRKTTFVGDARKVTLENGGGEISWEDLRVDVSYSSDLDTFDVNGDWPRVEFRDAAGTSGGVIEDLTIDGESERVEGDLYDGDVELRIGKVATTQASGGYEAEDVYYVADSSLDGDFMSVKFGFGTGEITGSSLSLFGSKVDEMHYDFTARRLHTRTLARLMTAIKESYTKPPVVTFDPKVETPEPIKARTFELFQHDPEMSIDRLGLTTPDGEAYFKGVIRFKGVTEEDLAIGGLGLIGKLDAEIQFAAHRKVLEKFPGGATSVGEMIDDGYVVPEGDKLVSKIAFRRGGLMINGKPQGIPGLGPPPGTPGPEGMPPQE
jgi:uncharacterized protein YdgA (DUF945 family)